MALSSDENRRLTDMLQDLTAAKGLKPHEEKFVQDQLERHAKWGADIFLSPKQLNWLEVLHERETGQKRDKDEPDDEEETEDPDAFRRDLDDEIPF